MPQPAQLPIRRVTFYKHGVSMVEREGRVQGEALQLGFRDDDIGDALKSLTVRDRSGGQVVCIDYQIPAAARKEGRALELGAGSGLLDLVERLTGWRVRAELAGCIAPVEGRVVERQEHLRRNIGALAAGGDEGAVRLQMVRELQAAESSLSGIDQRVGQLKDDNMRIEQSLGASLPDAA